jgi:hypothetical protein
VAQGEERLEPARSSMNRSCGSFLMALWCAAA